MPPLPCVDPDRAPAPGSRDGAPPNDCLAAFPALQAEFLAPAWVCCVSPFPRVSPKSCYLASGRTPKGTAAFPATPPSVKSSSSSLPRESDFLPLPQSGHNLYSHFPALPICMVSCWIHVDLGITPPPPYISILQMRKLRPREVKLLSKVAEPLSVAGRTQVLREESSSPVCYTDSQHGSGRALIFLPLGFQRQERRLE